MYLIYLSDRNCLLMTEKNWNTALLPELAYYIQFESIDYNIIL